MDALMKMVGKWREDRKTYGRINQNLVNLSKGQEQDLIDALQNLADTPIPYSQVEDLTGYAKGSLINRDDLENIGTRANPAFRLGDLPYKAGYANNAKLLLALASFLEQTDSGLRLAA